MKKIHLIAVFLVVFVLSFTIIAAVSCASGRGPAVQQDVEDCDHEDFRNREDDCGFTDSDRANLRTQAPKVPKKKTTPKPRRTR